MAPDLNDKEAGRNSQHGGGRSGLTVARWVVLALVVVLAWWFASPPRQEAPEPELVVGSMGRLAGRFIKPRAVAVAPDGRFYVVDRSGRIQQFDSEGQLIASWEMPKYDRGQPVGLTVEEDGHLLVSDSHYSRVVRFTADGQQIVAHWGTRGDGPGQITWGRDVVADSAGNVYLGDYGGASDRIHKYSRSGEHLATWGQFGEAPGEFKRPQGMAIEVRGGEEFLLVADCSNHRVQRFTLQGDLHSVIGSAGTGEGQFRFPMSVAVDAEGSLYVCEWGNNRIQKLSSDGASLGFWGGPGRRPGRLATPWDIEIGADGRIYVVDTDNHRVQVFRWPDAQHLPEGVDWGTPPAAEPEGAAAPRSTDPDGLEEKARQQSLKDSAGVLSGKPASAADGGGGAP